MIFVFDENAGNNELHVKGELFKYLIKVRRHKEGDSVDFRAESSPKTLHRYLITTVQGREVALTLQKSTKEEVKATKYLHLIWCLIDPKSIEKVLPTLNEIGVAKISFVPCKRSQSNFKLDFKRLRRIATASMQQCGRSEFMEFEMLQGLEEALKQYNNLVYFDFGDTVLQNSEGISTILIGCEGGFSNSEKQMLQSQQGLRLDSPMTLRSESAVCAIASKILL